MVKLQVPQPWRFWTNSIFFCFSYIPNNSYVLLNYGFQLNNIIYVEKKMFNKLFGISKVYPFWLPWTKDRPIPYQIWAEYKYPIWFVMLIYCWINIFLVWYKNKRFGYYKNRLCVSLSVGVFQVRLRSPLCYTLNFKIVAGNTALWFLDQH